MVYNHNEPDLLVCLPRSHVLFQVKVLKLCLNGDSFENPLARLNIFALNQLLISNNRCCLAHDFLLLQMLADEWHEQEVDTEVTEQILRDIKHL